PSLLFLGHTDVVLADPAEWSVPPFSGELRDGMVWGRGAIDMKSQVAANAVAFASLAREGFRPSGDLIFAATADEENGTGFGLEVKGFMQAVFGEVPPAAEVVERVAPLSPVVAVVLDALLAPTFSPTMISASQKRNVIPALCGVEVDCRLLPGQHPEHVEPMI